MLSTNEFYVSLSPELVEKVSTYVDLIKEQQLRVFKKPKPSSVKTPEIMKKALEVFLDNAFEKEKLLSCGLMSDIKKFDFGRYRSSMEDLKSDYAFNSGILVTDESLIFRIIEEGQVLHLTSFNKLDLCL